MQLALRPYVTPGVAIAGAALIAVNGAVPAAVLRPQAAPQPSLPAVQHHAVQLTADFFTPWTDLFTNTANNLVAMGTDNGWGNLLEQIITDPSSLSRLPEVFDFLGQIMPTITGEDPLMVLLSPILTIGMGIIGPLVTVNDEMQEILNEIFNPTDPMDPFAAIFTAFPRLLDAFLNGTSTIDIAGISIPAFNGILAAGQNLVIDMTADDLVDGLKIGDETIAHLLDQTGIGTMQAAEMITGLLDAVGLGDQTPVDVLDMLGLGDIEAAAAFMTVLDAVGIGNPTIADIMDMLGIGDVEVADLVIDFTDALGFDNTTVVDITEDLGLADLKLADLGVSVFQALGIGDPTVNELLGDIGADDLTLNGLLLTALDAFGLGGQTPASLIDALGGGDLTTHQVIGSLLNGLGLGDQTMMDLLTQAGIADADVAQMIVTILGPAADTTMGDVLDFTGLGGVTLGQMVDVMGITNLTLDVVLENMVTVGILDSPLSIDDVITATGGAPMAKGMGGDPLGPNFSDMTIGSLLGESADAPLSSLLGDMATQTLGDLLTSSFSQTLGDALGQAGYGAMTLTDLIFANMPDQPLAELFGDMGNTTLADLVNQLVPADQTIADMLGESGIGDQHISELLHQYLGDQTVANALDDGGLGGLTIEDIIRQALGVGTVNDMLNDSGLGGQSLSDLLDQFFGTSTLHDQLLDLGLGAQTLNELVESLLGTSTISALLGDFGTQTVDELLASMGMGDMTLINAQIEEFFGSMAYWLDGLGNQIAEVLGG